MISVRFGKRYGFDLEFVYQFGAFILFYICSAINPRRVFDLDPSNGVLKHCLT